MGFLAGKKILITGVLSDLSIAYGIAEAMNREGASLALTYQNEKFKNRLLDFAKKWDVSEDMTFHCDVSTDESITKLKNDLSKKWDEVDTIIHAIAYAPKNELSGNFIEKTTKEGFLTAHDISSYSFLAMARIFKDTFSSNASMLTLSYLGAEKVVPNYNVMGLAKASLEANVRYMAANLGSQGIRVNAISAGPIRTLAASGIQNFRKMLDYNANRAPMGRNVTIEEVGNVAAFLSSDLSSGITGEIIYVDAGFNITAMGINE